MITELPARRTKVWALDPARLYVTSQTVFMECGQSSRKLVVPAPEAEMWQGVPCLDPAVQDCYVRREPGRPTWAGDLYRQADIRRIVSAEHTALVSRQERDRLQERFSASDAKPWEPNLLSATPTLELGVDIGDLSTVVMCSVPPAPVNYVQRTGRAGRRDGNALALTVATGQPHDLYYYAEPMEMLGSRVEPPGIFLNAPAVLERQLTAFCLDCWVASGVDASAVPRVVRTVLNNVERTNAQGFPHPFFDFIAANGDDLLARFFRAADGLYLYREFRSEAVRMLIPATGSMDADRRMSSFIAALELGLRRRFSGAVDHLRVMTCRFPAAESGAGIDFLMLYDTVPGGTGYLKQMMTDPDNVLAVFRMARDALMQCACNADPLGDGCYRCVYAYRRSREMTSTSRNTAVAVLNAILEQAEDLQAVDGLRSVKVNPVLESELEARFIEALRRVDVDAQPVRVREDIVGGKPGYVLTTAGRTWYMEAQVELGESDGVEAASRPDFVIRPARESPNQSPIAVFMDGFEFHRDRTDKDSVKRLALVRAGYLVWSMTWHDLEAVLGKGDDALDVLGGDDGHMAKLQRALDALWDTGPIHFRLGEPSLELLVRYLRNPDTRAWKRAVFTHLLGLFQPADMQSAVLKREFADAVARELPSMTRDAIGELPEETAFAGRGKWRGTPPDFAQVFLALPLTAVEPPEPDKLIVAVHLDDAARSADRDYRRAWNGVLRLYNLLQFLPNGWWTTALGVRRDSYPEFTAPEPGASPPYSREWAEAMSLADVALRSAMEALAVADIPPPEIGFELVDSGGEVVAKAELAWEAELGAVLLAKRNRSPLPRPVGARSGRTPQISSRPFSSGGKRSGHDRFAHGDVVGLSGGVREAAVAAAAPGTGDDCAVRARLHRARLREDRGCEGSEHALPAHRRRISRRRSEAGRRQRPHPAVGRQARRRLAVGDSPCLQHQRRDRGVAGVSAAAGGR